jgi:MFS family permease
LCPQLKTSAVLDNSRGKRLNPPGGLGCRSGFAGWAKKYFPGLLLVLLCASATRRSHGTTTGARHRLHLNPVVFAAIARQPQFPAHLAGADCQRDWRLVFYTLSIYTLLLQLTGHAGSVALALVLQVLPQTFVGPTAGVVNDRLRRKQVMIAADLVRFAGVLSMLFVRSRSMVWLVYPLLLAETTMAAFFEPARSAVIPNIATEDEVLIANTLSSATWSVNLLIGAAVGGVVAAFFGRDTVFILNAHSFLTSALLISGTRFAEPHAESAAPLRPRDLVDYSPVLEGIRYIRSHPTLLPAVFAKAGELMVGPSWVIFTVMGAREFAVRGHGIDTAGGAMLGMSILLGGRGLGAMVGPLFAARWAGRSDHRLRLGILFGYLTIAAGYGVLGASRSV